MKDTKVVILFLIIGLAVAYIASGPLREPESNQPKLGASLQSADIKIYAKGTVRLASGVEKKARQASVLFLFVRSDMGGPPIAVKKMDRPSFPLKFELTQNDNMVGDEFFNGDLNVVARLDHDGLAGPKSPDDLEGIVRVKKEGPRDVEIIIGKKS